MNTAATDYHITRQTCRLIVFAPLLLTGGYILLLAVGPAKKLAQVMLAENQIVELLTFLALIVAGISGLCFASRIGRLRGPAILWISYAFISFGMIFVAMEEIAWGQWFFGFATPENFAEYNIQGELTLHNLSWWHDYIEALPLLFGIAGALAVYVAAYPVLSDIAPSVLLLTWFVTIAVVSAVDLYHEFHIFSDRLFKLINHLDEVMEMLVAFSALLYIWLNARKHDIKGSVN